MSFEKMNFEVESKFVVADISEFIQRAIADGANFADPIEQVDWYFNHPVRDFGNTDEALRVRMTDGQCRITYKGPKISAKTKTRREIELPFAASVSDPQQVGEMLIELGFRSVAKVKKIRRSASMSHGDWKFSIDVDEVVDVGSFVELDTSAEKDRVPEAELAMAAVAEKFGLTEEVRLSYLEMLLAVQNQQQ